MCAGRYLIGPTKINSVYIYINGRGTKEDEILFSQNLNGKTKIIVCSGHLRYSCGEHSSSADIVYLSCSPSSIIEMFSLLQLFNHPRDYFYGINIHFVFYIVLYFLHSVIRVAFFLLY